MIYQNAKSVVLQSCDKSALNIFFFQLTFHPIQNPDGILATVSLKDMKQKSQGYVNTSGLRCLHICWWGLLRHHRVSKTSIWGLQNGTWFIGDPYPLGMLDGVQDIHLKQLWTNLQWLSREMSCTKQHLLHIFLLSGASPAINKQSSKTTAQYSWTAIEGIQGFLLIQNRKKIKSSRSAFSWGFLGEFEDLLCHFTLGGIQHLWLAIVLSYPKMQQFPYDSLSHYHGGGRRIYDKVDSR